MSITAVLVGRTATDLLRNLVAIAVVLVAGFAIGYRLPGGVSGGLAALGVAGLFGYAATWLFAWVGLAVRDPQAANFLGFAPVLLFVYLSSAWVPVDTMHPAVQGLATHQPVNVTIEAVRALADGTGASGFVGRFAGLVGRPRRAVRVAVQPQAAARHLLSRSTSGRSPAAVPAGRLRVAGGAVGDEETEERRQQIMDAVVDVTVEGGLANATFRTIAKQAGVSVRLVQYYFGDKATLLGDTLTHVQEDIGAIVASGIARLGDEPGARDVLRTIGEALLPLDERRRRATLVFLSLGTAALTDETLRGPEAVRRGRGLAVVLAEQLRRVRDDDHVDDDALLLVTEIVGLGNGLLAGDVSADHARRLLDRAVDRSLDQPTAPP